MNSIKSVLILGIFGIAFSEKFTKYNMLKETVILNDHPKEGVLVAGHFVSDSIFCILECNKHQNCESVSYNNANNCTLYNDLISLIHTTKNTYSTIYSKNKLPICNKLNYNEDNKCYPKKNDGITCSSSEQCKDRKNFDCINSVCQCIDTSK